MYRRKQYLLQITIFLNCKVDIFQICGIKTFNIHSQTLEPTCNFYGQIANNLTSLRSERPKTKIIEKSMFLYQISINQTNPPTKGKRCMIWKPQCVLVQF